jgi:zinc transport system substrate-binding protein
VARDHDHDDHHHNHDDHHHTTQGPGAAALDGSDRDDHDATTDDHDHNAAPVPEAHDSVVHARGPNVSGRGKSRC